METLAAGWWLSIGEKEGARESSGARSRWQPGVAIKEEVWVEEEAVAILKGKRKISWLRFYVRKEREAEVEIGHEFD